jgi:hypothetical protein
MSLDNNMCTKPQTPSPRDSVEEQGEEGWRGRRQSQDAWILAILDTKLHDINRQQLPAPPAVLSLAHRHLRRLHLVPALCQPPFRCVLCLHRQ